MSTVVATPLGMEFSQEADCCSSEHQHMTLRYQNGGAEVIDDFYVIETERWAFDNIEELVALLRKAGCREKRIEDADSPTSAT